MGINPITPITPIIPSLGAGSRPARRDVRFYSTPLVDGMPETLASEAMDSRSARAKALNVA